METRGVRWECMTITCLDKARWWRSIHGVVLCRNCQPPASPHLVAEEGGVWDAPLVFPDASSTPFVEEATGRLRGPLEASAMGLPVWILRGDRTAEKVEARGGRRKISLPPDTTHWCCEGDARWTPIERKAEVPGKKAEIPAS